MLAGDGLVSPQGRALDYRLAIEYEFLPKSRAYLAWRTLEGGADVDQVYNFTWINYAVVGLSYGF